MLSELYAPDEVHALPAINTTDEEQGTDEDDNYDDQAKPPDPLSVEGEDTAVASKVQALLIDTIK